jgi:hypothetical protein
MEGSGLGWSPKAIGSIRTRLSSRPMMEPQSTLKILLIKPHARLKTILGLQDFMLLEPLEFGYLASAVPGHDVRVLDLRIHRNPLRAFQSALRRFQPELVGFTAYSHEASALKSLARIVRERLPKATIIAGEHGVRQ